MVVVANSIDIIDGGVDVADGGCAGVINSDMAHNGGVNRLVGVSLACMPVSQMLRVSVDIPALFSTCSGLSLVRVVCVLESVVSRVVGSVCMSSSTWIHVHGSMHFPWPWCLPYLSFGCFPFFFSFL